MSTAMDWKATGRRKREDIQALLPAQWKVNEPLPTSSELRDATTYPRKFLTPREVNITEDFTACELLKALASGALSAVEVTVAFCHRATIAHQIVSLSPACSLT